MLTLQEEIARQISEGLRLHLGDDAQKRLARRYTSSTEATSDLKGRTLLTQTTRLKKSNRFFSRRCQGSE